MYTSIVVPLDGSAFGNRALPVAITLAGRSDAALHLVHVNESAPYPDDGPYDAGLHVGLDIRSELIELAAQLTRDTSLQVDASFLDGPVVRALSLYLHDRRPNLVVMMTHGRGGLSRMRLGSVADGLVRHTSVPLLLMGPGAETPEDLIEPLFRRILVPLDGSGMAEEVLDHVLSLGTPDLTVYVLVTVIVPLLTLDHLYADSESFNGRADVERERIRASAHLTVVAKELRDSGAVVETLVAVHQRPAQGILDAADDQHADVIALSTHGQGALSRLIHGSVADAVVRKAVIPVFVNRPVGVIASEAGNAA